MKRWCMTKKTKKAKKTNLTGIDGLMFYRNCIVFDQFGNVTAQLEIKQLPKGRPDETEEQYRERIEKFERMAMRFLAGDENWQEID